MAPQPKTYTHLPAPAENLTVPCVTNNQSWPGYLYPGILTTHPTGSEDYSIRGKFKVCLCSCVHLLPRQGQACCCRTESLLLTLLL